MQTPFDLTGKTALITGASRGIGRAIAQTLARAGADVVLAARTEKDLQRVAESIENLGRKAVVCPVDLADTQSIDMLVDCLKADHIPIDILINNAATARLGPLLETKPDDWHHLLNVNLTAPLWLTRAVVPMIKSRGGGAIVNVASIAGLEPAHALGAYAVTKAALIHMTRLLAHELAPHNIRVNAVAPGLVETDMAKGILENKTLYQSILQTTALRRHATPEEIAPAVLYLATPAANFTTGQILAIDGGRHN